MESGFGSVGRVKRTQIPSDMHVSVRHVWNRKLMIKEVEWMFQI